MGMNQLWAILLIASLCLMVVNHPVLMITVGIGVFVYWKNIWNIQGRSRALWLKLTAKKTPPPANRRPRIGENRNKWG